MYKSIIFDLGGVMVDFDPKAYLVDRLCNAAIVDWIPIRLPRSFSS